MLNVLSEHSFKTEGVYEDVSSNKEMFNLVIVRKKVKM